MMGSRMRTVSTAPEETPEERHEEFVRENGEWHRKVKEALQEVDDAVDDLSQDEEAETA